jgi:TetR/AcrR family transcriptional regulator, cholesterol catabolism regulator
VRPLPRIAEARAPAEPVTPTQQERQDRILAAAARLGAEKDLERVMMQEVAREADVAIATLYRYFPSKTHLFVGVMADQVHRLANAEIRRPGPDAGPVEAVADVLVRATRAVVRRPRLATAMLQSLNTADPSVVTDVPVIDERITEVLLDAAGLRSPDEEQLTPFRLLLQSWYGVLQSHLNGRLTPEEAESDLRTACRLLLAPMAADDPGAG